MSNSNVFVKMLKNKQVAIKGIVQYASVQKPNTTFDPMGVYSIDVLMNEAGKEDVEKVLMPLIKSGFEDTCKSDPKMSKLGSIKSPVAEIFDDEGEVTGYKIRAKQKARIVSKAGKELTFNIKLTDGQGKPMPKGILVGNGSECVVVFEPAYYFSAKDREAGVTLRLKEVRVLDLVEYGASSALDELGDEFKSDFDASTITPSNEMSEDDTPFETDEDNDDLY